MPEIVAHPGHLVHSDKSNWETGLLQNLWPTRFFSCLVGVYDHAKIDIEPIPSKYKASIGDSDTFYLEKQFAPLITDSF